LLGKNRNLFYPDPRPLRFQTRLTPLLLGLIYSGVGYVNTSPASKAVNASQAPEKYLFTLLGSPRNQPLSF